MNRKKIYPLYLAVIPAVVFTIFFIIPSTIGYYYAFTNWSAARTTDLKFVGLENILSVIQSSKVPVAFVNTLIYAGVKTVMVTILGFVFAYILNAEQYSKYVRHCKYPMAGFQGDGSLCDLHGGGVEKCRLCDHHHIGGHAVGFLGLHRGGQAGRSH